MFFCFCCLLCLMQMVPDVLLPSITCKSEFVTYFLNLLQDWTAAALSSRSVSSSTPLKTQTTPVAERNLSCQLSFRSGDYSSSDQMTRSFSSTCTPDNTQQIKSRHNSSQQLSSVKRQPRGLSDAITSVFSPEELLSRERQIHSSKPDSARHRPLRQHNAVLLTEYFTTSSAKERQGRALFIDGSAQGSYNSMRKSAGKHKTPVRMRTEKMEKTPLPSFNLNSSTDFPDMKSSQRYFLLFLLCVLSLHTES